jgi:hypothetical protein
MHQTENDHDPIGACVIVDFQRALTVSHLLFRAAGPLKEVFIAFPRADEAWGVRRRAEVSTFCGPNGVEDVAMLQLERPIPDGVQPAPILCAQPRMLLDTRWWAFGFPDGDPLGAPVAGRFQGEELGHGWLPMVAGSGKKITPGFSGTALWSYEFERVVALVGKANGTGEGRAISLYRAARDLPAEKIDALAIPSLPYPQARGSRDV